MKRTMYGDELRRRGERMFSHAAQAEEMATSARQRGEHDRADFYMDQAQKYLERAVRFIEEGDEFDGRNGNVL